MSISLILLIGIVACYFLWRKTIRNEFMPPGEYGWPIIGIIRGDKRLISHIKEWRKKHGDIITAKLGSHLWVFLCNYAVSKNAYNMIEMSGRPDMFTMRAARKYKKLGLMTSDGDVWQKNRSFAIRALRSFGLGKSSLADVIDVEVKYVVDLFKRKNGEPMNIDFSLNVAVGNTLLQLTTSRRYDIDDPHLIHFITLINTLVIQMDGPLTLFNRYPWLQNIVPKLIKDKMGLEEFTGAGAKLFSYFSDIIEEHKKTLVESYPRDYIDMYLIESEKEKSNPESIYKDDNYDDLITCLFDLFMAGSHATSTTIRWYCMYIAKHPKIQAKVHDEMDSVLAPNQFPTLDDRKRLPYFDASIHDLNRISSQTALAIFHSATADVMIENYHIPKGTFVVSAREIIHRDPIYWEKPNEFYPEHFLDNNGKVYIPEEGYLPFSVGRRQCMGEPMAKMELFLFLGAILNTFTIEEVPSQPINLTPNPKQQLFNAPMSQNLIFKLR